MMKSVIQIENQNEARQLEILQQQDVEKYFSEKVSGASIDRPMLKEMLGFVREGDKVYIESISRLVRNTLDFLHIVSILTSKGVEVISLKKAIDTSTPQGKFMLIVFGSLAELERENMKLRQREGINVAKANGTQFGRSKIEISQEFINEYKRWKNGQQTAI